MARNRWDFGRPRLRMRAAPMLAAILLSASCVPAAIEAGGPHALTSAETVRVTDAAPLAPDALVGEPARAANAALPLSGLPNPAAGAFVVQAASAIDRMRAQDCLAQAVYYEAANESEDGQRAVAQVVLNRMRHPAWPNSVCGVVYQGPMRAGGGCQFTFTCDGSLLRTPAGEAWARARRIAAEAMAGRSFEPVGLSTHYHANYVLPAWAPRLAKTAVIGAHLFYRVPGRFGEAAAFTQRYGGHEPLTRPSFTMMRRPAALATAATLSLPAATEARPSVAASAGAAPMPVVAPPPVTDEGQIREEYRHSGQWRSDSPIAPAR